MKSTDLIKEIETRLAQLGKETEKAKSSKAITDYLMFISQFHQYSFHNVLSIWMHCPNATFVAGYKAWQRLGRFVRKGEKGIPILAPCPVKVTETDRNGNEAEMKRMFFKVVYVFDVSQTEGKSPPEAPITVSGNSNGLLPILEQVSSDMNISLTYKSLDGSHHGTSYGGHIEVNAKLDDADKTAVIIHELAHELLHVGDNQGKLTRRQRELEAEATAFIVCSHLGLKSTSANYLALWDASSEDITETFQRIHQVATSLISHIKAHLTTVSHQIE